MHWEILLIPLVAIGVWILGTVFRGEEERPPTPLRRGPASGRPAARRPVTDFDQFLEEARRRREAGQRPAPAQPPRPAQPARPATPRRPLRERSSASQTPRTSRPTARSGEASPPPAAGSPPSLPEAVPVAEPVRTPKAEPEPVFEVTSLLSLAEKGGMKETVAPLTQQMRSMLRQPQSAGLAFMLREILDRPLSRRR